MTLLDGLMTVDWFFGLDLKTASFVIAALGVIHPMFYTCIFFIPMTYLLLTIWVLVVFYSGLSVLLFYGLLEIHPMFYTCIFFIPMTYLLLTIWVLVVFYSGLSVLLFYGLLENDESICRIWIWYSLIFVILMVALMYLHFIAVICKKRCNQMTVTLLGILWYMTTIYFILVLNTYRMSMPVGSTYVLAMESKVDNYKYGPKESTTTTPLNTTVKIENETLRDLQNVIDMTDNTVWRCKTNLTNLMGLLREKQNDAKKLLEHSRLNLRKDTMKLIDILFPPNKLNETRRLINMSIISDLQKGPQNIVQLLDSYPILPVSTTTGKIDSPITLETAASQFYVTESPLLEITEIYIEHSPNEDKDLLSRMLLQDEENKKRREINNG